MDQGFKQTEIGLIPRDWEVKNLGDNVLLKARIGWQGLTTAEYLKSGDYYLITGTDFDNGYIDWDNCPFVDRKRYIQDRNIQLKINDVLVTKDGTIGKVAFVNKLDKPATLNSGVFVLRSNSIDISNQFIYYILMSFYFDDFLNKITAGSTIIHLYQKDFVHFKLVVPPLSEQKAISESLSDADAWIKSIEQLVAKKRFIKQGAMQDLLRPKEGWKTKRLEEVSRVVGGGTPSTFTSAYWNGSINWFTPTEVGVKKYLKSSVRKITELGLRASSANILPAGTILLTSRAGIGDLGILTEPASTNQGFQSLIVSEGYSNEFMYYLLSTMRSVLLQNSSGSTFLEISPRKLKAIEIMVPELYEQTRLATILSDMDAEIELLEKKLGKARQIKQGMVQQLLTGKVRLTEANDTFDHFQPERATA